MKDYCVKECCAKALNAKACYASELLVLKDLSVVQVCGGLALALALVAKDLCALAQVVMDSYKLVFEPDETDSCKKDCFERVLELLLELSLKQALHTSDSNSCYSD